MLLFAIAPLAIAYISFHHIWTFKSDLIPLKGVLSSANVYHELKEGRRGSKSNVYELIFYIVPFDKKFTQKEAFDEYTHSQKYHHMKLSLEKVDSVTVWIRKDEMNEYDPEVYELYAGTLPLLTISDIKTENRWIFISMLVLGLAGLSLAAYDIIYPEKGLLSHKP